MPEAPAAPPAGGPLTEHVPIRFDPAMIAAARQLAAAEGMTVSAWIRREVEREIARRTPPAGGHPQEAATPLSLAAEWEDDAHAAAQQGASPFLEVAYAVRTCAEDVRQRLAPAWDALAAGNERLRAALESITAAREMRADGELDDDSFATVVGDALDVLSAQGGARDA